MAASALRCNNALDAKLTSIPLRFAVQKIQTFGDANAVESHPDSALGEGIAHSVDSDGAEYLVNFASNALLQRKAEAAHEAGSSCIGDLRSNRACLWRVPIRDPQDLAMETTHHL